MSIRALRTLIAVHRHGSFRAAADAEGLTPSAVSHQMKNLEHEMDLVIFDRSLKTPALTQSGLLLVKEAARVLEAFDALGPKVRANDELAGELILGAVPTTLTGLIPLGLSRLKNLHPRIRIRIVPGLTNQLLLQLERGQIDAAVVSQPDTLSEALDFARLASEELVLLVAQNTPDKPPQKLLRTLPFIRFTRDAVVGKQVDAWLHHHGIVVAEAMELEGLDAISSMVAAELGVSIVPQSCIEDHNQLPLRRLSLGPNGPKRVIGLVSRVSAPRKKMVAAVKTALVEALDLQNGSRTDVITVGA